MGILVFIKPSYKAFWLFVLFSLNSLWSNCQNLKFETYSIEDGLSNSCVYDIFKDSKGFLWASTDNGLNRFDGYNFKVFNTIKGDSTSLSYHKIRKIVEDKYGHLWVATHEGLNVFNRESESFIQFLFDPENSNSISNSHVIDLLYDSKGNLWVQTLTKLDRISEKELSKADLTKVKFEHYNPVTDVSKSYTPGIIQAIFEDSRKDIWVATNDGFLNRFDWERNSFSWNRINIVRSFEEIEVLKIIEDYDNNFWLLTRSSGIIKWIKKADKWVNIQSGDNFQPKINSNNITDLFVNNDNKIWIATDGGGINIYDPKTNKTSYITYEISNSHSLPTNAILRIVGDKSGIVWIGTFNGGISKFVMNKSNFGHYTAGFGTNNLSGKNVTSFSADKQGLIWIGTDGSGLNVLNREKGTIKYFKSESGTQSGQGSNIILSVFCDEADFVWLGTWQSGLVRFNKYTHAYTYYKHNPFDSNSIASNNVFKVFIDSKNNFWVGTLQNGLDLFDRKTNRFIHFKHNAVDSFSISNDIIFSIYEDSKQRLWIGNNLGVDMIDLNQVNFEADNPQVRFKHYKNPDNLNAVVNSIIEDHNGKLWFGNERTGINILNPETGKYEFLNISNGLNSNTINGILEDNNFNIWIATNKGLSKFNPSDSTFKNYEVDDGIQAMEFNRACFKSDDGQLFFGGINGFNAFFPEQIGVNTSIPATVITDFRMFNKSLKVGDTVNGKVILEKSITETHEIRLSYRDNFFTIVFASLDFTSPHKNQFSYKMEGIDKNWNDVGNKNEATYTNLGPGTYVFKVKSSNNDNIWNTKGATLNIIITPPFWQTGWMYAIYLIAIAGLFFLSYYIIINNEKLKNQVKLERLELQKTKEINKLKLNFFTNISHELRTPLTLMLGPLETIIHRGTGDNLIEKYLTMVYRNARQLKRLINQLLDFRMIEEGAMLVEPRYDDIIKFIRSTVSSFDFMASQRKIDYTFNCSTESFEAWFDMDKLEKILLNLISNAFKYTPDNKSITINVSIKDEQSKHVLCFEVIDTGMGIPGASIDKIFSVFYREKDQKSFVSESTGLGLSLTKSLVEVLGGKILVKSEIDKGSTFSVQIPLDEKQVEITGKKIEPRPIVSEDDPDPKNIITRDEIININDINVLIVEDNIDVVQFLENELKSQYMVHKAFNGKEGFEKAIQIIPEIIISDVMMPEMDGKELCRKLKLDLRTSHIPIILLTAKQSDEYRIEGYGVGADEYLSKPFNPMVLKARISNLLDNRARLRELFSKENNFEVSLITNNQTDTEFLKQVIQVIENNIGNYEFDINIFANELNLGRSIFFKKIKALTNETPHMLVSAYRMKKAAEYLTLTNKSISEIAYEVGFTEPSNFTRTFTKYFNMSPSKYIEIYKK